MLVFYNIPRNKLLRWLRRLLCQHGYVTIEDENTPELERYLTPRFSNVKIVQCKYCGKIKEINS